MLCLLKTHALGLFSHPGPVETFRLLCRLIHMVCCQLSRFDVLVTQVAAKTSDPQSTLLDANRGTCSFILFVFLCFFFSFFCFLVSMTSACKFPLEFFSLGDCWGRDCAFFLNGFVATQHYCVMYTRLLRGFGFFSESAMNIVRATFGKLTGETIPPRGSWAVCKALA